MSITKKLWGLIPLLTATVGFAQPNKAQCPPRQCSVCPTPECGLPAPTTSAYNAPAQIRTKCPWDVYGGVSFIYWQAIEEDFELGELSSFASGIYYNKTVNFDFQYKPGFKLDLGVHFDYDNWDLFADYTWYHTGNMTTKASAPGIYSPSDPLAPNGPSLISRITGLDPFSPNVAANFMSRTWKLKMDFLDLMLARSFYVGKQLIFRPSFGARGAWIRQRMSQLQTSSPNQVTQVSPDGLFYFGTTTNTSNSTVSWGYGLKGALETDWMLGCGFRMFGNGAADILYTRYNLLNTTTSPILVSTTTTTLVEATAKSSQKHLGSLRPHMEFAWGFGYERYFDCCKWDFDLAASYNFQVFWKQNMFLEGTSSALPADALFVHGLNITASASF
jgi:hypothetical protein